MEKILQGDAVKNKLLELRKKMEANGTIKELSKEKFERIYGDNSVENYKN